VDEEEEREAWLLRIGAAALRALDSQRLWEQEATLLAHRRDAGHGGGGVERDAAGGRPLLGLTPARLTAASPHDLAAAMAALSAPSDRQRLQAGVFRPSHILPTMTVEQFGEQEQARVAQAARAEAAREAARVAARADMGSDEEEEERLAKARSWDDWKVRRRGLWDTDGL
jgi:immunoglobulin-binding protein 1